jgi:UDP-N-acetylmuramoyl-L-alanyl-D-glutamate--2,6-diaminopimelate ligase
MTQTALLSQLIGKACSPDPEIRGIASDSRAVQPGDAFFALPGNKADGRLFIADAIGRGAAAIVVPVSTSRETFREEDFETAWVEVENPRQALALAAARFFAPQPETTVAVTGTNGKTSIVTFTRDIWARLGNRAASVGTLGVQGADIEVTGSMTTPDPVKLYSALGHMALQGITHVAMEASSHGLDQHRLDGVKVRAAAFTNLTRDHLDYHGNMENYAAAKLRLFRDVLQNGGTAVVNADTPEYPVICKICESRGIRVFGYGYAGNELRVVSREAVAQGQNVVLDVFGKKYEFLFPLVGEFQIMNALCAAGLVLASSGKAEELAPDVVAMLKTLPGVSGRLQPVPGHPKGAAVYVDYAHTPDALENILTALRPHARRRLVCLFGCGGDRDTGKRPVMGEISFRLADLTIITDDNPRSEDPAVIRAAIRAGAPDALEIPGRREAIRKAVSMLKEGDVLVLAGKGHEQGQIFAGHTEPFDDAFEAHSAMQSTFEEVP